MIGNTGGGGGRWGGGRCFKHPAPLHVCSHRFNFRATLFCGVAFSSKLILQILIGGPDLAVRGVSKFKVDLVLITFFSKFNIMLEIANS